MRGRHRSLGGLKANRQRDPGLERAKLGLRQRDLKGVRSAFPMTKNGTIRSLTMSTRNEEDKRGKWTSRREKKARGKEEVFVEGVVRTEHCGLRAVHEAHAQFGGLVSDRLSRCRRRLSNCCCHCLYCQNLQQPATNKPHNQQPNSLPPCRRIQSTLCASHTSGSQCPFKS